MVRIYTLYSNFKNTKDGKIKALEKIYSEAIFLLSYPFKSLRTPELYSNDNEYVQKSVRRKIKDYQLELDNYWSYYCKEPYPDLKELSPSVRKELTLIIEKEYDDFMEQSYIPEHRIFSPAFYISDEIVNEKLQHIYLNISKHKSSYDKVIRELVIEALDNPPQEVKAKYEYQLSHDPTYFEHNQPSFADPYWKLLLNIRKQYEKYTTSIARRLSDFVFMKLIRIKHFFSIQRWKTT